MVEAGCNEADEQIITDAIEIAHEEIKKLIKVQKDFDLKDAGEQLQKAGEKVVKGGKVVLDKTGRGLKKGFEGIKKVFKKDGGSNDNSGNNTNEKPSEEDKIENVITE